MSDERPQSLDDIDEEDREEFYDLADAFIDIANDAAEDTRVSRVSAAFMYACARYNAYALQVQGGAIAEIDEEALAYLVSQYEEVLRRHMKEQLFSGTM